MEKERDGENEEEKRQRKREGEERERERGVRRVTEKLVYLFCSIYARAIL